MKKNRHFKAMHSIAIIAILAIIGFSFIACDEKTDDNETTVDTASFAGTWKASGERSIVFTGNTFNYKVNNVTQYSGTFSASGSTITFNESNLGTASGNFTLTATTLTLSNHTWDNSVNGTYTKEGGSESVGGLGNKVYMAGYEGSSARAMLWNGDISQQLSDEGSRANSVFVSGSDVYAVGNEYNYTAGGNRAILWKNNTAQMLSTTRSNANSVYVSGSDVYAVGEVFEHLVGDKATVWKNGTAQTLSNTSSRAYSIFVSGSNVYAAGFVGSTSEYDYGNRATLWVNGTAQTLSTNPSNANSIYVSGSDVYVAGVVYVDGNFRATLWKNGIAQTLNNTPSIAYNVFISGSDVYVAGLSASSITLSNNSIERSSTRAMLWKNDTEQTISTPMSEARSVFVLGSDVYVGGFGQTNVGISRFAKIWKNGTEYIIGNASSYIHSVFVLP